VDTSATNGNNVLSGVYRDDFVCRHREAQTARSAHAVQTLNYTAAARAGQTARLQFFD
jgi:hypothetical protein